ncbi:MAG: pyridoxal-phosphate dependent enzyme [Pseudomonadota bacterium]
MHGFLNPYRKVGLDVSELAHIPFPSTAAEKPAALLSRCPSAAETPLLDAPALANRCGVAECVIKDERGRMGLGSFKALGAAYVIAQDNVLGRARGQTYVTASAGNHGLSVAAGAAAFGARAIVVISEQVPEAFAEVLAGHGADVRRAGQDYEASMLEAAGLADEKEAVLLSDSSWPGYVERPHQLMEGYLVLMAEVFEQIEQAPTHIFLQAGVGGLAGAAAAIARAHWGEAPRIVVVEPEAAPALAASIDAGRPVYAQGPESVMGRLDCKEPSLIALKGLARDADIYCTISEDEALMGAKIAAKEGFATSASGAAGLAAALVANRNDVVGLRESSRVLVILSERAIP